MTAVGLGRMKAASQLHVLQRFGPMDGRYSLVGTACYCSIEQITGEKIPDAPPIEVGVAGWFLE